MDKETKEKFFRKLYDEAYGKLYTFLGRKQANKDCVEDVIQETFLEAYSKVEFLMGHPNQMGWLYVTAKNKAMKLRANRKEICCLDSGMIDVIEDDNAGAVEYKEIELAEVIKKFVGENEYEMFCDYYANDYTYTEIAEKYGISENSVRMRMSRLKKKLKDHIFNGLLIFAVCIWGLF